MSSAQVEAAAAVSTSPVSYTISLLVSVLALSAYYYYASVYSYFRRRGLKGPTPLPLVGNLAHIFLGNRRKLEVDWTSEHGKIYGIFHGTKPRVVINDPEVLRQICIKDFAYMPNHESSAFLNAYQKNFIVFVQDERWKRLRSIQSPTFTSGKIKRMYKLLDRCADDLVLNFSEHLDDGSKQATGKATINLKNIYYMYTMDAITTAAYTIKLDRKLKNSDQSPRGNFVTMAEKVFKFNMLRLLVSVTVPTPLLKLIGYEVNPSNKYTGLEDRLRPIMEQRRNATKKYDDYLQILTDARMDDRMELDQMDEKENHHAGLTKDSLEADQQKLAKEAAKMAANGKLTQNDSTGGNIASDSNFKLTDEEVIAGVVVLLAVGLDTTGTLLTNCTYVLAFHPDVQEKLYQTIKSIAEFNAETGEYTFDYEKLTSCEYLDAVISESLRLLSPVLQVDRMVKEDYYVEKYGVKLRKGDKLLLGYNSIMNNPEFWPEPSKFDPERFVGDNKKNIVPGSYCPFGLGPRHCLGMRFSLTEAKLALAKVLMRFRFSPAPGTSFPPEFNNGLGLVHMKSPMVEMTAR